MANCKGQIANGKLEDKVFLIYQVAHDKVLEYFKAGDIFVLTPATKGFPTSVGSDGDGNTDYNQSRRQRELIENGKEGFSRV